MTTDDPAPSALHRIERAMDSANDLIGELIRRLDDPGRPRLRVLNGGLGAEDPRGDESAPRLHIVGPPAGG